MKTLFPRWGVTLLWTLTAMAAETRPHPDVPGHLAVAPHQKVAFLGDSITQGGWSHPVGYVRLVAEGLRVLNTPIEVIPAGISGHKSNDMLARLDRDVISHKPDWMILSCGVNDVWHGARGVPLEAYEQNMTAIVDKAQAAQIQVLLLTATLIGEDPANANNQKARAYNDFLRELARQKHCLLADLNAQMQEELKALEASGTKAGTALTSDGVHMNAWGNIMMARGILKALGASDTQLKTAENAWLDMPNGATLTVSAPVTLRQYQILRQEAAAEKKSLGDLLNQAFKDELRKRLP